MCVVSHLSKSSTSVSFFLNLSVALAGSVWTSGRVTGGVAVKAFIALWLSSHTSRHLFWNRGAVISQRANDYWTPTKKEKDETKEEKGWAKTNEKSFIIYSLRL